MVGRGFGDPMALFPRGACALPATQDGFLHTLVGGILAVPVEGLLAAFQGILPGAQHEKAGGRGGTVIASEIEAGIGPALRPLWIGMREGWSFR
jgi:hypothetical protein